jgi:hypothetical protein
MNVVPIRRTAAKAGMTTLFKVSRGRLWVVLCCSEMRFEPLFSLKETLSEQGWEAIFGQERKLTVKPYRHNAKLGV